MIALRASFSSYVRLERKICYNYTKLKAKGKLDTLPMRYAPVKQYVKASATTVATSLRRDTDLRSINPTTTGEKSQRSQDDPDRDNQILSRRTRSLAGWVLYSHELYDSGSPRHFTIYQC